VWYPVSRNLSPSALKKQEDYNFKSVSSFPPKKLARRQAHARTAALQAAPPTKPAPLVFLTLSFLNGLNFRQGVYQHELTVPAEAALPPSPKPLAPVPVLLQQQRWLEVTAKMFSTSKG